MQVMADRTYGEAKMKELQQLAFVEGFEACRQVALELIWRSFLDSNVSPVVIESLPLIKQITNLKLINLPEGPIQ